MVGRLTLNQETRGSNPLSAANLTRFAACAIICQEKVAYG